MKYRHLLLPLMLVIPACTTTSAPTTPSAEAPTSALREIADAYIKLTL